MKIRNHSRFNLFSLASFLVVFSTSIDAGTTSSTFSFQRGDLRKDGELYGDGASYAGTRDGRLTDDLATRAFSNSTTATLGNQFQNSSNGQNYIGLFSFDLTSLNDFIAANTSPSSSVSISAVSLKLIASSATTGSSHSSVNLFRCEPFATNATWSTTNGTDAWSNPYQKDRTETAFNFTGGGSTASGGLAGSNPSTASKVVGSVVQWTSAPNFVTAANFALSQPDKKLYLMAARSLGNDDGRFNFHSSTAATVDERPELVVSVIVNSFSDWTGASSPSWANAGNWTSAPTVGDPVRFNSSSLANLATVLDQDFSLSGIAVTDPTGPVSIGGTNNLTLGLSGLDLSQATQNLTITAPLTIGSAQVWNIASGRTLNVSGPITGSAGQALTLVGAGKVSLGASGILPNGAASGNLIVSGTLDLNGTSQSINGLTGGGTVDNTAAGASVLTVGNNNASFTFSGILKNTSGTVAVNKTGSGEITLSGANTFSGGFTNNGSGDIVPASGSAFGTGPVVINNATVYQVATLTIPNTVTLNGGTLRIGGGNSRIATWSGPVTSTGSSGLNADNGTGGVILGNTLAINGGTFTSFANATTNFIQGDITGSGNLAVTSGTLQLSGAASYSGTTTISTGCTLRVMANAKLPGTSSVTINGSGIVNIRNSAGWSFGSPFSGTGDIVLNSGTNADLAGTISGSISVLASGTTTASVSGDITDSSVVQVTNSAATLTLSGNNSYSGATTVSAGKLVVAGADALSDNSPLLLGGAVAGNATLEKTGSGTDTASTLDVTGTATLQLGTGAAIAFANSSAVSWTGGALTITGNFVSGASIRFGSTNGGLTPAQLALISAPGFENIALNANGYLTASPAAAGYDTWKAQITNGQDERTEDADSDGFTNLQEFLFGTSPIASTGTLVNNTSSGGNLILRWLQRESGASYQLKQSGTLAAESWSEVVAPAPAIDSNQTGAPADYDYHTVTLPTNSGKAFFRVEGLENN